MRSDRGRLCALVAVATLLSSACSYEWNSLRPLPNAPVDAALDVPAADRQGADVVTAQDAADVTARPDVVTAPDVIAQPDVVAPRDVVTPTDLVAPMDVVAPRDVVSAPDVVDVPAPRDVVDVVDVPAPRDVVDVVDVPAPRDVVDVVVDTGPSCVGLSCPCVPGNSAGYCPVGQRCVSGACAMTTAAGALIITEVMNDTSNPVGEPDGEWIEVYNPAAYAVDIRGMRVRDGSAASSIPTTGPALLVLPLGYAVIARTSNLGIAGGPTVALATYDMVALNNSGSETITLATTADATIDTLTYGSGWPNTAGRSKSLMPGILDATMNDSPTNFCAGGPSYTMNNFGTPGAPNVCM